MPKPSPFWRSPSLPARPSICTSGKQPVRLTHMQLSGTLFLDDLATMCSEEVAVDAEAWFRGGAGAVLFEGGNPDGSNYSLRFGFGFEPGARSISLIGRCEGATCPAKSGSASITDFSPAVRYSLDPATSFLLVEFELRGEFTLTSFP